MHPFEVAETPARLKSGQPMEDMHRNECSYIKMPSCNPYLRVQMAVGYKWPWSMKVRRFQFASVGYLPTDRPSNRPSVRPTVGPSIRRHQQRTIHKQRTGHQQRTRHQLMTRQQQITRHRQKDKTSHNTPLHHTTPHQTKPPPHQATGAHPRPEPKHHWTIYTRVVEHTPQGS